ncbi:RNA polymerase sigma factor [Agromyces soli]
MANDRELLSLMAAGSSDALAETFQRYGRPVYARAYVELGVRQDAEEVMQDAFLLLWKKRKRIHLAGESLLPWLLVSTQFLSANRRRKSARHAEMQVEPQHNPDRQDPASVIARAELGQMVAAAVRRLEPLDQSIFQLCVMEGFSYKQAAHHLRVSNAVVRNRLSRSRRAVRADVSAYLGEDS